MPQTDAGQLLTLVVTFRRKLSNRTIPENWRLAAIKKSNCIAFITQVKRRSLPWYHVKAELKREAKRRASKRPGAEERSKGGLEETKKKRKEISKRNGSKNAELRRE